MSLVGDAVGVISSVTICLPLLACCLGCSTVLGLVAVVTVCFLLPPLRESVVLTLCVVLGRSEKSNNKIMCRLSSNYVVGRCDNNKLSK